MTLQDPTLTERKHIQSHPFWQCSKPSIERQLIRRVGELT